jgi:hypothetical protein
VKEQDDEEEERCEMRDELRRQEREAGVSQIVSVERQSSASEVGVVLVTATSDSTDRGALTSRLQQQQATIPSEKRST